MALCSTSGEGGGPDTDPYKPPFAVAGTNVLPNTNILTPKFLTETDMIMRSLIIPPTRS